MLKEWAILPALLDSCLHAGRKMFAAFDFTSVLIDPIMTGSPGSTVEAYE